ncbi:MAG: glycosyltransferase [Defluviitaleaceae bacterium]|nr:glycosyltransferase [Defluviitaleaceae bacterium]
MLKEDLQNIYSGLTKQELEILRNKTLLSVILATYNRAHMLPNMLECLAKQDFEDYELIIINDGSKDDTKKILDTVKHATIKHIPNSGLSNARNLGLSIAKGEYIAFIDDDDKIADNYLSFLYNLATEETADIAICGSYNDFGNKTEPRFINSQKLTLNRIDGIREFLKRDLYNTAPPGKLFKKSLFENIQFIDGKQIDDIHVIYKVFEKAEKVVVHNVGLLYKRKHDSNISLIQHDTQAWTPELLQEYIDAYLEREDYLMHKAPELEREIKQSTYNFMLNVSGKIELCFIDEKKFENQLSAMKGYLDEVRKHL